MPQEAELGGASAPAGWCGRTSPEPLAQTKGQTLPPSSTKPSKSSARKPPLFLSLNTDGQQPDASLTWEENGALRGEFSTHSFGEYPSAASASHLSAILEASPHPKYSLSAKACQGILRRAERRGKPLPPILREALERQAAGGGLTYCIQGNCIDRADTAGCNGKDWTEGVAYTLNTVDRPAVVPFVIPVENHAQDCRVKLSEDGTVQTLSGKMGTRGGNVPLILGGGLFHPTDASRMQRRRKRSLDTD